MIKLEPYYSSKRSNGQQLLDQYLHIVADVVPFYREDVLYDRPDTKPDKARNRTKSYLALLDEKTPDHKQMSEKQADARLAKILIYDYSVKLHDHLYEGCTNDGHINPEKLRALLSARFTDGNMPSNLEFNDKKDGHLLLEYVFRYKRRKA